jgi:hypothetical protein
VLNGQFRDDLANVAIVVDEVFDSESLAEKIFSMLAGAGADLRMVDLILRFDHISASSLLRNFGAAATVPDA